MVKVRLPLAEARVLAEELLALLKPACARIEIAGSIRRGSPDVGDIELVCIPLVSRYEQSAGDLFGSTITYSVDLLAQRCDELVRDGVLSHRLNVNGQQAWGDDNKLAVYKGFAADIFTAMPETWGVTMAIRTGPAEFSKRLVTPRQHQGLCPSHLRFHGWRVCHRKSGEPMETREEADVFAVLGMPYLAPEARD